MEQGALPCQNGIGKPSDGAQSDAAGMLSAELGSRFRDSRERNFNAALSRQIFYLILAQRKAEIEPNRTRYDLSRKTITLVAERRNIGGRGQAHDSKYRSKLGLKFC